MSETESIAATAADGTQLEVRFARLADRYAHELWGKGIDSDWQRLAVSIEGTPLDDWPPSPAFQQLLIETRGPGRRIGLLVGMSGSSHWSGSIEPVDGHAAMQFDLACRVKQSPREIGSRYQRSDGPESATLDLSWDVEAPATLEQADAGPRIMAAAAETRLPATIRWRFRIALVASAPRPPLLVLDGSRVQSLDDVFDEVSQVAGAAYGGGRNLDALDEWFRAGSQPPQVRWREVERLRAALGYAETVRQLERQLATCHPSHRDSLLQELDDARRGVGPTVFDWLRDLFQPTREA